MNKGYTLAELMIYMVLGLIVVGYSLTAINHLSKNYVTGREVTKMQQTGRDAINLLARDLMNTGFKYYLLRDTVKVGTPPRDSTIFDKRPTRSSNDSLFLFGSYTGSYVDASEPSDSAASFFISSGDISDTIETFRARLVQVDKIGSVERSKYFIQNDTLMRVFQENKKKNLVMGSIDWSSPDTVAVIENAAGLQFQFSENGYDWIDDPEMAGTRDKMRYIRISLVIASQRESTLGVQTDSISIANTKIARSGSHLYRTYEQVITIHNNGVLAQGD